MNGGRSRPMLFSQDERNERKRTWKGRGTWGSRAMLRRVTGPRSVRLTSINSDREGSAVSRYFRWIFPPIRIGSNQWESRAKAASNGGGRGPVEPSWLSLGGLTQHVVVRLHQLLDANGPVESIRGDRS